MGLDRLDRAAAPSRSGSRRPRRSSRALAALAHRVARHARAAARSTTCRARPSGRSRRSGRRCGESPSDEDDARRVRRELAAKYAAEMDGLAAPGGRRSCRQAKVLRAVYSERQLDEVLVDFWMNHFNVFAEQGPGSSSWSASTSATSIRPHAWGRFEDLLQATAQSPAMLFYLDNWLSGRPRARAVAGAEAARAAASGRRRGLNENYAREIMELHTLGVDGGYTQKDVTEVARCFTGWTIRGLRAAASREFVVRRARPRPTATRSCSASASDGRRPGARASRSSTSLATPPATARFISLQAGAPLRGRRAAAGARGPRGRDLPQDGRRHPRRW